MTAAENIKSNLMAAIRYVETKKHRFTRNPGMDFTRNRKLGMGDTITALISMNGGTLQRELLLCFTASTNHARTTRLIEATTYMLLMVLVSIWQGTPALHALSVTKVTWKDIVNSI